MPPTSPPLVLTPWPQAGSNSLAQSKSDWPSCTNGTWNNICVFSEKLGKQHIGYATCLSQSVARSFVEHGKDHVSELNAMDVKVRRYYTSHSNQPMLIQSITCLYRSKAYTTSS